MLQQIGGHRSADELVAALREGGYHHARTTVYNALDDLARAGLVRAAPVDAGALRYEANPGDHHHFVCRGCGLIVNVPVSPELALQPIPVVAGGTADELDVIYRGVCVACAAEYDSAGDGHGEHRAPSFGRGDDRDAVEAGGNGARDDQMSRAVADTSGNGARTTVSVGGEEGMRGYGAISAGRGPRPARPASRRIRARTPHGWANP
jgi:Fe2+ or Zn2+ uptake regulation protein